MMKAMERIGLLVAVMVLMTGGVGTAEAHLINYGDLIVNGNFAQGVNPGGDYLTLYGGDSTSVTAWKVTGRDVDYISGHWLSTGGGRSFDLSGSHIGGLEQDLMTNQGQRYTILFDLAGNSAGGPAIKRLEVSAAGTNRFYSFNTTGKSYSDMGWVTRSFNFAATDVSTTLSFTSLTQGYFGPALGNVREFSGGKVAGPHSLVPEPASVISCGIAGLAGLGFAAWRRRARLAS